MRALRYALEEAVGSLWRGRQSAVLSTATIAVAVFVLGAVLVTTLNLERLTGEWSHAAGVSVYLDDNATAADREAIERLVAPSGVIAEYEFVSKGDALKRFKETFTDLATTIDTLESNPLPASYELRLQPNAASRGGAENLGSRLRQMSGVADVRYDRQWIDRLLSTTAVVRGAGLILSGLLTLAAALTVANVVRLALYARRDELTIMQLVGAPQLYLRGPFVVEGVLQGGIGATVALALLSAAFFAARSRFLDPVAAAINLSSVRFLTPGLSVLLVVGGMLVGCIGGLTAAMGRASRQPVMES